MTDDQQIVMTSHQLAEFCRNTVHATLVEMGLKAHRIQNGRIYRTEMVEIIGRWDYDKAVREGKFLVYKKNPLKRNSRVYTRREDWDRYLRKEFNREL
jgi:hypothetical protein